MGLLSNRVSFRYLLQEGEVFAIVMHMAKNLGFEPTGSPFYFFLSYNGDETSRVGPLARALARFGVPIWYDDGIDLGKKWEEAISTRVQGCEAVLLIFSKGILSKDSYVRIEYEMAKDYFGKRICPVFLDEIDAKSVPAAMVPWIIELRHYQGVEAYKEEDLTKVAEEIARKLDFASPEQRRKTLMKAYEEAGKIEGNKDAERYLDQVFSAERLSAKAHIVYHLLCNGFPDSRIAPIGEKVNEIESLRIGSCLTFSRGEVSYAFGTRALGARDNYDDVALFYVNDELSFHVGPSPYFRSMCVYCDNIDDIVYAFLDYDHPEDSLSENPRRVQSILAIDHSSSDPVFSLFKMMEG